jgi:pSer/pThr/pTyr-binding forkhead associated (FHA) protein
MDEPRPPEANGLPVQGSHRPARPEPDTPPEFTPLRLVLQPSGATIELNRPDMLVGRHSEADVRLPLPDVSRRHCRFLCVEGCWQVVDLNSLNGVYVNDEPVLQAALHQGDLVRIGGFTFAVDLCPPPAPAAEAPADDPVRNVFKVLPRRPHSSHQRRLAS